MRVLMVEDERPLAVAVQRGLEDHGFDVDLAHDGAEGLWLATECSYDAIILDIMLPEMNGYSVCSALRAAGRWTPVLMLTAKHGEHDEAEALDTGADDFLSKPFSFVVLRARLRALCRRNPQERPTILSAGSLSLDLAQHRCRVADEEVFLTRREFAVLETLMRRAGDVLTKSEILDQVWGFAYDGDPNIVEVYIGYLRRKLDRNGGCATVIQAVRGVGYRVPISDA